MEGTTVIALRRIINGRVHYLVDTLHADVAEDALRHSRQWFPEHQPRLVRIEIVEADMTVAGGELV